MATFQSITSQADGFVVVSLWKPEGQPLAKGSYEYEHQATLNEAFDLFRDYEGGQWQRARAVGIFASKDGLPIRRPVGAGADPAAHGRNRPRKGGLVWQLQTNRFVSGPGRSMQLDWRRTSVG